MLINSILCLSCSYPVSVKQDKNVIIILVHLCSFLIQVLSSMSQVIAGQKSHHKRSAGTAGVPGTPAVTTTGRVGSRRRRAMAAHHLLCLPEVVHVSPDPNSATRQTPSTRHRGTRSSESRARGRRSGTGPRISRRLTSGEPLGRRRHLLHPSGIMADPFQIVSLVSGNW